MFGWRSNRSGEPSSVIDRDTVIQGPLRSRGSMEIRGHVTGAVVHEGRLTIGPGGCCVGPVRADELHIYGEVQGDADVSGILRIGNGGRLTGDVICGRLVVDAGGTFLGRNRVGEAGTAAAAQASPRAVPARPEAIPVRPEAPPKAEVRRAPEPAPQAAQKPDEGQADAVTFRGFMRKR